MEDRHVNAGIRTSAARPFVVAALVALLAPGALAAQGWMPGRRGDGRTQLEQRIRARFGEIVRDRLGLSDEQARQLGKVVQGFQGERMRLAGEEDAVRQRVDSLLRQGQPSDSVARTLLARMSDLRAEEVRLARHEEDSLLTVLSPSQLLRFNVLREELGARIRQLRRGQGPMGRGPAGRGMGGGMPPGGGIGPGGGTRPDGTMPDPPGSF